MLKAVTPDDASCTEPYCSFFQGSRGQADDPRTNGGFFRDGSLLAIVLVSAREDCSAVDVDLFNSVSSRYLGSLGLRCLESPSALHPVERYVAGLAARRSPARLVFGALSGTPVDVLERASMTNDDGATARSRCPGDGGQRIDFTPGAEPSPGTALRIACRW